MNHRINVLALLITIHMHCNAMEKLKAPLSKTDAEKIYNEAAELADTNTELQRSEALFLSIKDQFPLAYSALVTVASKQDALEKTHESAIKLLSYAKAAVEHDFTELTTEIGFAYERLELYNQAREYYEKAISATGSSQARINLARLLLRGEGGPEDPTLAVRHLQAALKSGNKDAIYDLAAAYAIGNGTLQDPAEAYRLYSQIIENPSDERYPSACNDVGSLYEWGLIKPPKNRTAIQEALKYFTMAKDATDNPDTFGLIRAKTHIARLIWTGKIDDHDPVKKEQAKNELKDCANQGDDMALSLYSAILINQGDIDQAIDLLRRFYEGTGKASPPLIKLQLAIAYQDGWTDISNSATLATDLFQAILVNPYTNFRSSFLTRAYMYIMGIGVEKNEQLGFSLLEESKKKHDDIFLDTYALFPQLKKIEEDFYRKQRELTLQLLQEEEASKVKKQKGKSKPTASISGPSRQREETPQSQEALTPSIPTVTPAQKPNILDLPIAKWNTVWAPDDGSAILTVKRSSSSKKITITIIDPSRDEELLVLVDPKPYLDFNNVRDLMYDPRVQKREAEDLAEGKRDHVFARMLDYVIQCAGKLSMFAKDGSDQPKDQIIATVTRVNKRTKRETRCKAEYTFYRDKNGKEHLYHRLLRPIK